MDARRLEPALAELRGLLGDRLSTAADERARHGADASYHPPHPPDAVAYPTSLDELVMPRSGSERVTSALPLYTRSSATPGTKRCRRFRWNAASTGAERIAREAFIRSIIRAFSSVATSRMLRTVEHAHR